MTNDKSCPFCDSHNTASELTDVGYYGVCLDCGATGPVKSLRVVAMDSWNTRPEDTPAYDPFAHLRLDMSRGYKFAGEK